MKRWTDVRSGRDVWLLAATTVDDWPEVPPWESERFGLLVATDRVLDVQRLAHRTLAQGLAVVAAFGPECTLIESVFDETIVGDGSTAETIDSVIMTTSHADEALDEVLEFFLDTLFPATDHAERCTTWVVFAVGSVASDVERLLDARDANRTWNILYTGVALAGCQTSLSTIAKVCDPEPTAQQLRSSPCEVRWPHATGPRQLQLMHEYYSNLYVPRLMDALDEHPPNPLAAQSSYDWVAHWNGLVPGWRALATFLETVHGVIFIVDSQRERIEAGLERLERLATNLRDCGRQLSSIAIVFQFNKRDCPSVVDVNGLRDSFRWPGPSAFVESVASKGRGVREALDVLIDLLGRSPIL